jgi:ankyrin repeat protein
MAEPSPQVTSDSDDTTSSVPSGSTHSSDVAPAVLMRNALTAFRDADIPTASWLDLVSIVQAHGAPAARASDLSGQTALHLAVELAKLSYCELLLQRGADVDAPTTHYRWAPLHHCADAEYGHAAVAALLLRYGANVDARDLAGETPLFHAARYGHRELVQVLIAHGANVNATDNEGPLEGSWPLCEAVSSGNLDIVTMLVHAGANADPDPSRSFRRPDELARLYGMDEICQYLQAVRLLRNTQNIQ